MSLSLLLLPLLFVLSGFFSASETALFSLRRDDREWFKGRKGSRAARCVLELLEQPRSLLVAVLWGNLIVNFLLMSVCARLVVETLGQGAAGLVAGLLVTTVAVVVLGEVTPKAIAVTVPRQVALLTAPPLLVFRRLSRPVVTPLGRLVGWGLDRVERRIPEPQGELTDRELKRFVELHGEVGALEREASEFLAEVLELGSRRVHEVMTPRVDVVALDLNAGRAGFLELVRQHRVGKVPVHRGGGLDTIDGYISTRDALRQPDASLAELVRPLWFVPSTKSLESLLREMIERQEQVALVIGEYGGTHGLVTLEDVVEEITGDIAREDERPLLRPGPTDRSWIAAGRFPLRELGELLGLRFAAGPTTLSGWIGYEQGRLPEAGDVCWAAGVKFRVHSVEGRRAKEVVLALPESGRRVPRQAQETGVPDELTHSGAQRASERLREWVAESTPETEPAGSEEAPAAERPADERTPGDGS